MAPFGTQTVFGFATGLDWRPTLFVNPFPSTSVCNACGFVPSMVATLPCSHILCQLCYERSAGKHGHCPLDTEPLQDENVLWSTMSKESILGRKVRCWNADNGCEAEDTASAMLEHFANACEFHSASCPRCGDKLPHRDIPNHLESTCAPSSSREQPLGENLVNAVLEVKEALGKISQDNTRLYTKLDSLGERLVRGGSMVALPTTLAEVVTAIAEKTSSACRTETDAALAEHRKEALAGSEQAVRKAISEEYDKQIQAFQEKVLKTAAGGKKLVDTAFAYLEQLAKKEAFKKRGALAGQMELLTAFSLCFENDVLDVSLPYEWTITDWKAFCARKDASREHVSRTQGEARYYFGYLIVPELCYFAPGDCIWFRIYVIKGLFDKLLTWPMKKRLQVRLCPDSTAWEVLATSDFEWIQEADNLPGVTKEVLYTGYSKTVSISKFTKGHYFHYTASMNMELRFLS